LDWDSCLLAERTAATLEKVLIRRYSADTDAAKVFQSQRIWAVANRRGLNIAMNKIELYSLMVLGLVLLPITITNRGAPAISAKRALEISADGGVRTFLLRHIWIVHFVISLLTSAAIIALIECWDFNSSTVNGILIVAACALTIASGALASMPSYIIITHWKRRQRD
jgi:hypothetical protein